MENMTKTSIVRKTLRDQLEKCKVAPSEEMRRYERGILLGMVTSFKITDDIDVVEAHNYLTEIVEMITIDECIIKRWIEWIE